MSGASFSLTEKLAVTGAFLALVAMAVGTEEDPGVVVTGQETVTELRPAMPAPAPVPQAPQPQPESEAPPPPPPLLTEPATPTAASGPAVETEDEHEDGQFSTELGRVPRDFSKGPPPD